MFARPGAAVTLRDLVDRVFRGELLGADPFQREWLWHRIWELDRIHELPLPALGLIDVALWDLAGRVQNRPVWQLLGGFRDAIPAYASTSTFATTDEFLSVADQCLELGYRGIKLHAWGDARKDAALCQALRDRVGPDIPLMYDGSAGFDLPDAIYLATPWPRRTTSGTRSRCASSASAHTSGSPPPSASRCWSPRPPTAPT